MSTPDLLARLARLDERDRAWLLGELPPALRRELAEVLADEDESIEQATPAPAPTPATGGWETMEPERVAEALVAEPVWMVSAATRTADPRWRNRLLHAMSSQRRREIEIADRGGRPLGARAAQFVLAACRERVANGATALPGGAPRQGFAALVDQMKSRFA